MPKTGMAYQARGGTVFVWDPTDAETEIGVVVPASAVKTALDPMSVCEVAIPGADLNEFIAHILSAAVSASEVLLFPSLRVESKLENRNSKIVPADPKDAA
jgi:hypothetical protein